MSPVRSLLALGLASVAMLAALPATTSSAEPRPSLSEVSARVDALTVKADAAVEEYANAKLELAAAARRTAVSQGRVRTAQAELNKIKKSMSSIAAAAYRSGGADQFMQLVNTSTPQTFLDRASSLDRIAAGQSAQLSAAATARHRLEAVQQDAAREQATQKAAARALAAQKASIERILGEQKRLLSSLRADERRRLEAARAANARRAADAARASRTRAAAQAASSSASDGPSESTPTYNGPASGRASIAVQEAHRKLGSPYQWGASGPDRFDCSGLTMWVWGKAGVSLPHSSKAQYSGGRKVSQSELQPGDLTFYGSPIHHVGIYIGNGSMISAPQTGDVVKIQNAFRKDYVGAVRP